MERPINYAYLQLTIFSAYYFLELCSLYSVEGLYFVTYPQSLESLFFPETIIFLCKVSFRKYLLFQLLNYLIILGKQHSHSYHSLRKSLLSFRYRNQLMLLKKFCVMTFSWNYAFYQRH